MPKILRFAIGALLAVLLLAACGDDEDEGPTPTSVATTIQITPPPDPCSDTNTPQGRLVNSRWVSPSPGEISTTVKLEMYAEPRDTTTRIECVVFTGAWNGIWHVLCRIPQQAADNRYACEVDLTKVSDPLPLDRKIGLSYDIRGVDASGKRVTHNQSVGEVQATVKP